VRRWALRVGRHLAARVYGVGAPIRCGDSDPYPAFWTPGHDSDHDGILNERDARPRNPFPS
jgi:hypothetical protein